MEVFQDHFGTLRHDCEIGAKGLQERGKFNYLIQKTRHHFFLCRVCLWLFSKTNVIEIFLWFDNTVENFKHVQAYHPAWYEAYKDKKKFLVYFKIEKVLPLVVEETDRDSLYVRVKDGTGSEFLCPIDALVDPKDATEEEMANCVDSAVVGRYAGNVKVVD